MFSHAGRFAGARATGRSRPDAHERLSQALIAIFNGGTITLSRQRSWASATFIGARHRFIVALENPPSDPELQRLPGHEFAIPGHIVADICMIEHRSDPSGWAIEIEALTVEEN